MGVTIRYDKDDYGPKGKSGNGNGNRTEKEPAPIPPSGKFCPLCHIMVANGDPDGENVPGKNDKRRHISCMRRLGITQSKDTGLCESANL